MTDIIRIKLRRRTVISKQAQCIIGGDKCWSEASSVHIPSD